MGAMGTREKEGDDSRWPDLLEREDAITRCLHVSMAERKSQNVECAFTAV